MTYTCAYCRFGVPYVGKEHGVSFSWLHGLEEFGPCPPNADEDTISRHFEVYLYALFAGVMFCNTAGDYVLPHLVWLARDIAMHPAEDTSYSWGSAVLAATYRGLCDACQRSNANATLSGCLLLLQLWSWEYLPISRPRVAKSWYPKVINEHDPEDMRLTMGYRWTHATLRWAQEADHGNYKRVIADLDFLTEDEVTWYPWSADRAAEIATGALISSYCTMDREWWMTTCFLLYMNNVEVYSPERVQRQFGYIQAVPVPDPRTAGHAHG